jgi:hypothetical protein
MYRLEEMDSSATMMEFSLSMSLSMSMSMDYSVPQGSLIRTLSPVASPLVAPVVAPVATLPTLLAPLPSLAPASGLQPTLSDPPSLELLECSANGLVAVVDASMTPLDLTFSYEAQIENSLLDDVLVKGLELAFVENVVQEVLNCNNETTGFPRKTQYQYLHGSTAFIGE